MLIKMRQEVHWDAAVQVPVNKTTEEGNLHHCLKCLPVFTARIIFPHKWREEINKYVH